MARVADDDAGDHSEQDQRREIALLRCHGFLPWGRRRAAVSKAAGGGYGDQFALFAGAWLGEGEVAHSGSNLNFPSLTVTSTRARPSIPL